MIAVVSVKAAGVLCVLGISFGIGTYVLYKIYHKFFRPTFRRKPSKDKNEEYPTTFKAPSKVKVADSKADNDLWELVYSLLVLSRTPFSHGKQPKLLEITYYFKKQKFFYSYLVTVFFNYFIY